MNMNVFCQTGPAWLAQDRNFWPINSGFVRNIPKEETRVQVFTIVRDKINHINRIQWVLQYSNN